MITLWGRNNSTNVKKVRWTLEELDLPYNQILAGLEFGLNHEAEYLAKNPNGLVPLLIDDETQTTLWESNSIVRYLAAQYGINRLWIDAPAQRAQAEKWMDWANGTLSPVHRIILTGLVRTPPAQRPLRPPLRKRKRYWLFLTPRWASANGCRAQSSGLAISPSRPLSGT